MYQGTEVHWREIIGLDDNDGNEATGAAPWPAARIAFTAVRASQVVHALSTTRRPPACPPASGGAVGAADAVEVPKVVGRGGGRRGLRALHRQRHAAYAEHRRHDKHQ